MTMHLQIDRMGTKVPACQRTRYLRQARGFDTTEDRSKVDCKRCANWGSFAPAPKAGPANPGGTCQVCFAEQRVIRGQAMTLHGYLRPGIGYIVGDCRGSKNLPFEKDNTLTVKHLADVKTQLLRTEEFLKRLQDNDVQSLGTKVDTEERNSHYGRAGDHHRYIQRTQIVNKGDAQVPYPADWKGNPSYGRALVPSFETLRQRAIANTESDIRALTREIAFLTEKLAGWTVKELLP